MVATRVIRRLRDLEDVDAAAMADGTGPVYQASTGLHVYMPGGEGPPGPPGPPGASTLTDLTDVTGAGGVGQSPVDDGAGTFPLTRVTTEEDLDAILETVAAVTWGDIPLVNGFTNYGQGWAPARYRLTLNNVTYIQGMIKRTPPLHDSDAGLKIGTLPPEAAPGFGLVFSAPCDGQNPAEIDVMADGSIVFRGLLFGTGQASWLSLSNIAFSVEGAIPKVAELAALL